MILAQLNPIGLYTSKDKRLWDDLISNTFTVKYVTNKLPAISLVVSGIVTGTIKLYDCEDNEISSLLNLTDTVGESLDNTVCTLLSYAGSILTGKEDGFYYYKITLSDTTVLYSDMFEWITDTSDLVKFSFSNCLNLLVGDVSMSVPAWDFYLEYDASADKFEKTIEVDDDRGINNASSGTAYKIYAISLIIDKNVYDILNVLPIIRGNGNVTCSFNGEDHIMDNIDIEDGDYFVQIRHITLKFVDRYKIFSMLNA